MKIKKCKCLYFSPTGTTKKIINKVCEGINIANKEEINFTKLSKFNSDEISFKSDELVVIGVPVYAGRIPIQTEKFIKNIKANKSLAIVVVLYGNRDYDDALLELKESCEKSNFRVLAGGAFIGEHSMSSESKPIAEGRPDQNDLETAYHFGVSIKKKIDQIQNTYNFNNLKVPGNSNYRERKPMPITSPITNDNLCIKCRKCILACPTEAITNINSKISTEKNSCIFCHACVKACPTDARKMEHIVFKQIQEKLFNICKARKEPEIFI